VTAPIATLAAKLVAYEAAQAFADQTGNPDDQAEADGAHNHLTYWAVRCGLSFTDDRLPIPEWARQRVFNHMTGAA